MSEAVNPLKECLESKDLQTALNDWHYANMKMREADAQLLPGVLKMLTGKEPEPQQHKEGYIGNLKIVKLTGQ